MTTSLRIAAAQLPVSADIGLNLAYILRHIKAASSRGAQVVHSPECALSGYGPRHIACLQDYPWEQLEEATAEVCTLAQEAGIWVVLGSMRQGPDRLPRNSTLVLTPSGEVAATYDKRRLYGTEAEHYSPGTDPVILEIHGVRCGFLICYENCFPSLYAEYRRLEAQLIFHSFYNAGNTGPSSIQELMRASLLVRAADNGLTISASNSCEPYSPLPACIVRPDGSSVAARRHTSGIVIDDHPCPELGWTYPPEP